MISPVEDSYVKQLGKSAFGPGQLQDMRSMLDDPDVSAEHKNQILYGLSTMGEISDAEIRRYASAAGVDPADCIGGGQAPMQNISNLLGTYEEITDQRRRQAQEDVDGARSALRQGGFSTSDQIVDQGMKGLRLFEDFYPAYQRSGGRQGGGGSDSGETGTHSPTSRTAGGPSSAATYSHSGLDPRSLEAGVDEFRGIDFAAFRADVEMLNEAYGSVEQANEHLAKSWNTNTADWTGNAKSAAQQRNNNLTEGAGDLSQALRIAPENVTAALEDGVQRKVIDFCRDVLDLYGDGTVAELTPPEAINTVELTESLPGIIEHLEEKIREMESGGVFDGISKFFSFLIPITLPAAIGVHIAENIDQNNIKEETEKTKRALREAERKLREFRTEYETKASSVHRQARTYVQGIQEDYSSLIESLGKALDPAPFATDGETGQTPDESRVRDKSGSGGSVDGGSAGGSPNGGGGSNGGGSTAPSAPEPKQQEEDAKQQEADRNPVTGKPLKTDPETGEPYPIDPETGEAVTDVGDERQSLTVQQGDSEIAMSEPDDDGAMALAIDDGSGEPHRFRLDFETETPESAADAENTRRAADDAPGEPDGAAADGSSSTEKVYRPGSDGTIHIERDGLEITAERPDGASGPTLVRVDDGSGEPITYTLGESVGEPGSAADPPGVPGGQDAVAADAGTDGRQRAEPEGTSAGATDDDHAVRTDGADQSGSAAEGTDDAVDTDSADVADVNQSTSAQGVFGDVFGTGESDSGGGIHTASEEPTLGGAGQQGTDNAAEGTAGLGSAPGGGSIADDPAQSQGRSGSVNDAVGTGIGVGGADDDREHGSTGHAIIDDLFGSRAESSAGADAGRISGSLNSNEDGSDNYVWTG